MTVWDYELFWNEALNQIRETLGEEEFSRWFKLVKPESFNRCFINWVKSLIPEAEKGYTVAIDGKTVRSAGKMKRYTKALHIVSAQIAELGVTFGRQAVYDTSGEMPAVRQLIGLLDLEGCMIAADALNCRKETARTIIGGKAGCLLQVKDNQPELRRDIADYAEDGELRKTMDTAATREKSRERIERRTAYATNDTDRL